jgi:hypothetical protein
MVQIILEFFFLPLDVASNCFKQPWTVKKSAIEVLLKTPAQKLSGLGQRALDAGATAIAKLRDKIHKRLLICIRGEICKYSTNLVIIAALLHLKRGTHYALGKHNVKITKHSQAANAPRYNSRLIFLLLTIDWRYQHVQQNISRFVNAAALDQANTELQHRLHIVRLDSAQPHL